MSRDCLWNGREISCSVSWILSVHNTGVPLIVRHFIYTSCIFSFSWRKSNQIRFLRTSNSVSFKQNAFNCVIVVSVSLYSFLSCTYTCWTIYTLQGETIFAYNYQPHTYGDHRPLIVDHRQLLGILISNWLSRSSWSNWFNAIFSILDISLHQNLLSHKYLIYIFMYFAGRLCDEGWRKPIRL